MADGETVEREVAHLVEEVRRLGEEREDGSVAVKFGKLFDDEDVTQYFEALAGTLKAAKKRGVITYAAPLLLKGAHDDVDIVIPAKASE